MSYVAATASQDRLVTTLFVACLVHGLLIMGLSFKQLLPNRASVAPSLEVVLVHNRSQTDIEPDDAHYASEQNLSGSGTTTEQVRAQSQIATHVVADNLGAEDGGALRDQRREAAPDSLSLVATRSLSSRRLQALRERSDDPQERTELARLMQAQAARDELVSEIDENSQLHSPELKELFISVNTRQANVARYLALWKKKIEQVGTLNFPSDELLDGLQGNPTLEVAIRADGALHEVRVRETSDHPRIDQSAMRIVRLASPVDPS